MRGVVWVILLFVAAVVAASTLGRNDGLVSFYWGHWRFDVSLNLFLLALVASCFVLFTVIRGVNALVTLPGRAREWRMLKRERAAQASLREALAELFAARYTRAQKAAQRALAIQDSTPDLGDDHELRVLAHLLAAASAHKLQDRSGRDEQVQRVFRLSRGRITPRAVDDGARMLAADWALEDRDAARAMQLLGELPAGAARRTQALRLKLQAARLDQQPLEALRTARLLAKHQGFSRLAAQGLLRSLACEALEATHDLDQLRRTWMAMDMADRRDTWVAGRAARRAAALGGAEEARGWLRPFWERITELGEDEREEAALALMQALPGLPADWLPRLEGALAAFPNQPVLQAAVGAAFAERRLWGKARRLLDDAARTPQLRAVARRQVWRTLAQLAREEGDMERAAQCEHEAALID
jgi:HemY protein